MMKHLLSKIKFYLTKGFEYGTDWHRFERICNTIVDFGRSTRSGLFKLRCFFLEKIREKSQFGKISADVGQLFL
jgi:hypothetical protein